MYILWAQLNTAVVKDIPFFSFFFLILDLRQNEFPAVHHGEKPVFTYTEFKKNQLHFGI